jgi:hypothetical protein
VIKPKSRQRNIELSEVAEKISWDALRQLGRLAFLLPLNRVPVDRGKNLGISGKKSQNELFIARICPETC